MFCGSKRSKDLVWGSVGADLRPFQCVIDLLQLVIGGYPEIPQLPLEIGKPQIMWVGNC